MSFKRSYWVRGLVLVFATCVFASGQSTHSSTWDCSLKYNFISDVAYAQIALTDSCDRNAVCNANPKYVPNYAKTNDIDAAVKFCQDKCEDAQAFQKFASFLSQVPNVAPPAGSCSQCTGFFFQRHTNGHEICGFYTIDLNDGKLNKVSHGHSKGSQLCIKKKVAVIADVSLTGYTDTLPLGSPLSVALTSQATDQVTAKLGWRSCGAQYAKASAGTDAPLAKLSFRFDVSEGSAGSSVESLVAEVNALSRRKLQDTVFQQGEADDVKQRRLAQISGSTAVQVSTCMDFVCPGGYTELSNPSAYCRSSPRVPSDCCSCNNPPCSTSTSTKILISTSGQQTSQQTSQQGEQTRQQTSQSRKKSIAQTACMFLLYLLFAYFPQ